mgnify:FL=1
MQERPYKLDWINVIVWSVAIIGGLVFWYKVLRPILEFL